MTINISFETAVNTLTGAHMVSVLLLLVASAVGLAIIETIEGVREL